MKLRLLLLVTIFLIMGSKAQACVCIAMETCELPTRSSHIFAGKVLDSTLEERKISLDGDKVFPATVQVSRVVVSAVYNGVIAEKEIIMETDVSTTCAFSLTEGVEYLFYAEKAGIAGGKYSTGSCSGTKSLKDATEDLKYLRSKRSTVEGTVSYFAKKIETGNERPEDPAILSRLKISTIFLEGERFTSRSQINFEGEFRFEKVPVGEYRLRLPLPRGYSIYEYWGDLTPPPDKDIIKVVGLGCRTRGVLVIKGRE